MATQSQIYDEIYAQRAAEFINRQRIANEQYIQRQEKAQSKRNKAVRELVAAANEKQRKIRLHHPCTRRQIGEAVKVHYKSDSIMMFELINYPGKMLRVNKTGKVEFASVRDDTSVFELEAMISGNLYFMCTAYRDCENTLGGKGWYLSMSSLGQLSGNGGKNENSQWILLEEAPPQPNGVVEMDGSISLPNNSYENCTNNRSSSGVLSSETNPIMNGAEGAQAVLASSSTNSGIGMHNAGCDGSFPGAGAGREILMKYFLTPSGVKFLQQPEYSAANALYLKNGTLSKILHRPDWPLIAHRFVDHTSNPFPELRKSLIDSCMSFMELKSYFECGYAVARGAVSVEQCNAALKVSNYWMSKYMHNTSTSQSSVSTTFESNDSTSGRSNDGILRGNLNSVELTGSICSDIDVLSLFYATPVIHIVQRLLGAGDVAHPLSARVVTTFPSLQLCDPPALFGNQWRIDGFTFPGAHSPYTLLVGVALTDIPETNCGNFCVQSGSHMSLLEEYRNQVLGHKIGFSEDPRKVAKFDLGEPTQLIMRAGDVFFCSQRTAYLHNLNCGATPTTLVYFKVSHLDHAVLKNTALESLWVEYKSASYYIESSDEVTAESKQFELDARAAQLQANARRKEEQVRQRHDEADSVPIAVAVPITPTNPNHSAQRPLKPVKAQAQSASPSTPTLSGGASDVKKTAPIKPSPLLKPKLRSSATEKDDTGSGKKKLFTAKESSILMDLLDVNRSRADLWEDTPVPRKPSKPAGAANLEKTSSASTLVPTSGGVGTTTTPNSGITVGSPSQPSTEEKESPTHQADANDNTSSTVAAADFPPVPSHQVVPSLAAGAVIGNSDAEEETAGNLNQEIATA